MKRDSVRFATRLYITDTAPDIAALPRLDGPKADILELPMDLTQPGAIIP